MLATWVDASGSSSSELYSSIVPSLKWIILLGTFSCLKLSLHDLSSVSLCGCKYKCKKSEIGQKWHITYNCHTSSLTLLAFWAPVRNLDQKRLKSVRYYHCHSHQIPFLSTEVTLIFYASQFSLNGVTCHALTAKASKHIYPKMNCKNWQYEQQYKSVYGIRHNHWHIHTTCNTLQL